MRTLILLFFLMSLSSAFSAEAIGILRGENEILIKTKSQGEVIKIVIPEGSSVKAGQTIAILDNQKEKIEYKLAKAEYATAERDYFNSKKLTKYISKDELHKKKNEYLKKKSNMELKKYNLDSKNIVSPFDGTVARSYLRLGESVSSGAKAFDVVQMKKLEIELDVDAKNAIGLKAGDKLNFRTELHKKYFEAEVSYVGKTLEKASGTIRVRLSLQNKTNDKGQYELLPGTLVKVNLNQKNISITRK